LYSRFSPGHSWILYGLETEKLLRTGIMHAKDRCARHSSKAQQVLYKMVSDVLFPEEIVLMNYRHPQLRFANSGYSMELDIFVPSVNLAFEYHGEQHYHWDFRYGSPLIRQQNDFQKKNACKEREITLVEIPYWWEQTVKSLVATVRNFRPELLKKFSDQVDGNILRVNSSKVNHFVIERLSNHPSEIRPASSW